ncbi:unnamed protein product [Eruca vesicaria subsp. sativa]|uniref:DUF506 family protein n=1 Tax=Eruca vesicaria subsp. sativa TaxID=29727 RepID=A0ABC8KDN3_ERUVS|nr:unnamed protein product [Eruca vesicaria subsp. sativa]
MVEIRGRFKRTESAFNVAVARALMPCDNSSGSDHSPADTADLSELVASYIEMEGEKKNPEEDIEYSSDNEYEDVKERLRELLQGLSVGKDRVKIMAVVEVAGKFVGDIVQHGSSKRQLMTFLRNKGFDAGLCKSPWERFGNNTARKYEFVDVHCDGDHNRYIVETNLAGEFEIARPTKRYTSIISQVPRVFVGTPEELKKLVRIMCHEIRRSMKQVGIHVPPWRRNGYMQAKWFGFYKRTSTTTNHEMVNTTNSSVDMMGFKGCKEEFWEAKGLKVMVGQLSAAFNAS